MALAVVRLWLNLHPQEGSNLADGGCGGGRGRRPEPAGGRRDRPLAPVRTAQGHHARHRLDEAIHAPVRLSLVAALAQVDEAEFAHVRDAIEVSDSPLSKQVAQLETVG